MRALVMGGLVACACISSAGYGQETYPARPVTVIVPLNAGSQLDILARGLSDGLARLGSQPFVVVNRDGAASTIGVGAVARSRPDGYTVVYKRQPRP